jgi:hypothetical protein
MIAGEHQGLCDMFAHGAVAVADPTTQAACPEMRISGNLIERVDRSPWNAGGIEIDTPDVAFAHGDGDRDPASKLVATRNTFGPCQRGRVGQVEQRHNGCQNQSSWAIESVSSLPSAHLKTP